MNTETASLLLWASPRAEGEGTAGVQDTKAGAGGVGVIKKREKATYHEHRRQIMLARRLGLTMTYNLFRDPACQDEDIQRLRQLHADMDRAILACHGWEDVDLRHDFFRNDRGQMRYTVSPEARRELLRRLLELNEAMPKTANLH